MKNIFCLLLLILSGSSIYNVFSQPANDDCANATDITGNLNNGTCSTFGIGGATDDLEPSCNNFFCSGGPNANPNENVWFSFTAPYDGTVRIIVNGYTWGTPNYDPIIAVYSACLPSAEIACNDVDGDGTNDDSINTMEVGLLDSNTTYYISIDPPCDDTGSFCLQIDFFDPAHCYNGVQDVDETGIDCGGLDCFACHCFNGIQDFDETDIDCGGADCQVCVTCTDNETCGTATVLTFSGNPAQACVTDCNTGASVESLIFGNGCSNINGTETVYFTFTTVSSILDITLSSFEISDPQIVLWDGACTGWYQCAVGTGGTVSINNYFTGTGNTYTLMVTSQSGQTGIFDLCIDNYSDLSACNIGDTLTAAPPPDTTGGNFGGSYAAGVTVQFCYTINLYKQLNCQYLHGIVPTWGECWDDSSFTEITPPASADNKGSWGWFHPDTGSGIAVIYNQTNDTINKQGGWFYLNDCNPCPTHNGDPNQAWGDGCKGGLCNCDVVDGHGYTWNVCFELTTKTNCIPNGDCSVSIKTWTDGQTGPYSDIGCEADPPTLPAIPSPKESCPTCDIFDITLTSVLCYGDSTGSAVATMDTSGTRPYTYSWNDPSSQTDSAALNLPAGTYTLNVVDALGCTDTDIATITEPNLLSTQITDSTMILCFGDVDGMATVSTTGGTLPYTFLWDDPSMQTDSIATGLGAGTYEVIVIDSNGCSDSATIVITEPSAPLSASISASTDLLCNGVASGDITINVTGGTTPYTYLWNDPQAQTNAVATGLLAGLYQVIISDANGCSASDTITISQPPALSLSISSFADANCGSSDGMVAVTPSGGTGNYTYLWNDPAAQTDSIANGLPAASYQVVVTDGNGCQDSISHNINNLSGGSSSITDSTQVSCNGDATGSLTVTPIGGTAPFTYLWNDPSAQTDSIANGIPAGTYTATVTDGAGCISLATSTIMEPSAISLSLSSMVDVACNGDSTGSATVNASGGTAPYTYLWNDPAAQTDSVLGGIPFGIYKVVVTDNNGCSDSANASISEPIVLALSITDSVMVGCNGDSTGSATATPTGGTSPYTYLWNDPSAQTDSIADNIPAGTYMVIITDGNGCINSITTGIDEPAILGLTTISDSTSCLGYADGKATVTITGGTANFSYIWSSGDTTLNTTSTTDSTTGLSAGTYYITLTDNNGCSAFDSAVVEEPLDITINISQDSAVGCNGDSTGVATASLSFGIAPYNYMWSSGDTLLGVTDTSNTVNGLPAGTHSIQVSDASGCFNSDTVIITEPTALDLAMTINNHVSCNGLFDGSAMANTKNTGTSPWDYVWSNGDSTIGSSSSINDVFSLAAGTYFVTVTDANGCSIIDTAIIMEPAQLTLTTNSIDAACGTNNGSATATPSGGTGQYTYLWDDPGAQTTSTATGLGANSYTITVTDSNNCLASTMVNINDQGGAIISIDSVVDLSCNGDASGSISISVSGGNNPLTYLWNNAANTEDIINLDAGAYSVTVTDSAGCIAIFDTIVTEPSALNLTMSSMDISCFGADDGSGSVSVTGGTSPYTYSWSDGLAQTTSTALGLNASSFTVDVVDSAGCTSSGSISLTEPAEILISVASTDNCIGESIATATATASGGTGSLTYEWDDALVQTTAIATGLSSGPYTITIIDSLGCIQAASAVINNLVLPTISASPNESTISLGGSVSLSASGGSTYNWTPPSGLTCTSCQNTVASPTITTEYIVFGTDANNCSSSDTVTIIVNDKLSLYLPDIFSPNGDNENDYVFVQGKGIKHIELFIIYDRWGEKVFENSDFHVVDDMEANKLQGWDGKYKGKVMNPAVFVYYVKAIFMDDSIQEEKGDFTLVN